MLVAGLSPYAVAGHRRLRRLRARDRQYGADRLFGRRQPARHVVGRRHERGYDDGLFGHSGGARRRSASSASAPASRPVFVALSGLLVVVFLMAGLAARRRFRSEASAIALAAKRFGPTVRQTRDKRARLARRAAQLRDASYAAGQIRPISIRMSTTTRITPTNARRAVAPGARMRPRRNRAQQDQDENDDEDGR